MWFRNSCPRFYQFLPHQNFRPTAAQPVRLIVRCQIGFNLLFSSKRMFFSHNSQCKDAVFMKIKELCSGAMFLPPLQQKSNAQRKNSALWSDKMHINNTENCLLIDRQSIWLSQQFRRHNLSLSSSYMYGDTYTQLWNKMKWRRKNRKR